MYSKKVSSNIFDSIEPIYIFLKAFGLFLPLLNRKAKSRISEPKIIDKIWAIFMIFCIICYSYFFIKSQSKFMTASQILMNAYSVVAAMGLLMILFLMIYQHNNWRNILGIVKMLHDFDQQVKYI